MDHINTNMNKLATDYDISAIYKIKHIQSDVKKLLKHLNLKSADHASSSSSMLLTESFCDSDHSHYQDRPAD